VVMINTPISLTIITKQSLPCQVTLTLHTHFWATVCKMVRPMPSDRCLSVCLSVLSVHPCLSVGNVAVLWPNGWLDQDETWHAGGPRPCAHCLMGTQHRLPQRGTAPSFRPRSVVAKWLDGLRCHLVWRMTSAQATLC